MAVAVRSLELNTLACNICLPFASVFILFPCSISGVAVSAWSLLALCLLTALFAGELSEWFEWR